jgi:putative spermidine/putrescine transport system ATP-binding protein
VLLLDEPLTALDASLRDRLRGELDRLLRSLSITAVYVTHDQAEAMELGDRIVVMRQGAIAQIGAPREIYFEPANRFVAEFVGAANIIEGTAENGFIALPGGQLQIMDRKARGKVVAMIRPETPDIVASDGAAITGRIESISFVGDRQRLQVSGAADKLLTIDAPNHLPLKPGEPVGLHVDPKFVRLLPLESISEEKFP